MGRDIITILLLAALSVSSYRHPHIAYLPLILLVTYICGVYFREKNESKRRRFLDQLKSYRAQLRAGGCVVVDEQIIRYDSAFTTYHINVGGFISTVHIKSPYRISSSEDSSEATTYSIIALLTGWWALPLGPIITLSFVNLNLFKRDTTFVAELIDGEVRHRVNEVQRRVLLVEAEERRAEAAAKSRQIEPDKINTGKGSRSEKLLPDRKSLNAELLKKIKQFKNYAPASISS